MRHDWVVYAKRPFGGPEQVLKYLARYTHRVAISNQRLIGLSDDQVTFRWKDYASRGRSRRMTIRALEFLRGFLLHVLPLGFMKIRHYGFMANRFRTAKLALARKLLDASLGKEVPVSGESSSTSQSDPRVTSALAVSKAVCTSCCVSCRRPVWPTPRNSFEALIPHEHVPRFTNSDSAVAFLPRLALSVGVPEPPPARDPRTPPFNTTEFVNFRNFHRFG